MSNLIPEDRRPTYVKAGYQPRADENTYRTLEEDLIEVFKKRDIEVLSITVTKGATNYEIKVLRKRR